MNNKVKVLLLDIETSPNLGYTWQKWEANILKFVKEWELLSVAYKWLGEDTIHCISRPQFKDKTDKSLTKKVRDLFDVSDIIIAHNGDDFDIKKLRAKFVQHGLSITKPIKTIDTKKIAKSQFSFNSNSLNDLAFTLGLGKKFQTGGIDLWFDCMEGDKNAWSKMIKYNKQDVALLEKVYLKLRSWFPNHPNLGLYSDKVKTSCPVCESDKTQRRGYQVLKSIKKIRFQCQNCGHWFHRSKKEVGLT